MPAKYRTSFFNDHIRQAQIELERRSSYTSPVVRQISTDTSLAHLQHALRIANQLGDDARKATCMRVLNWVRHDVRGGGVMSKHTCIVKIVGEPALSKAKAYREACIAQQRAWNEYGKSVGASGFPKGWPGTPPGFMFFENCPPPTGWTKPDRRGRSNPKKGSADAAALASLPVRPSVRGILTGIINDLSYKGAGVSGSGMIAFFEEAYAVGWIGDVYFARIPHAGRAAADHLARHPDHTIEGPANGWTIPEGLVEITEAEFDLISAEYRVKLERERAAKAEAA